MRLSLPLIYFVVDCYCCRWSSLAFMEVPDLQLPCENNANAITGCCGHQALMVGNMSSQFDWQIHFEAHHSLDGKSGLTNSAVVCLICGLLYSRVTCERASFSEFQSPPSRLPSPLIRESEVCGFSYVEKSHPCEKMLLVIPPLMSYPSDVNIYHECVVKA